MGILPFLLFLVDLPQWPWSRVYSGSPSPCLGRQTENGNTCDFTWELVGNKLLPQKSFFENLPPEKPWRRSISPVWQREAQNIFMTGRQDYE